MKGADRERRHAAVVYISGGKWPVPNVATGRWRCYTWITQGGDLGSTGQYEVEVACPGCQVAWLNS